MNHQNELISCPLNPIHKVKRSSMPYHLIRCKQQVGTQNIEECPYNSSHIWLKGKKDAKKHAETCPDKTAVQVGMFHSAISTTTSSTSKSTVNDNSNDWDDGEDWTASTGPVTHREIQIGRNEYS